MARLPSITDNVVLTQAPRSSLSGADIADPFNAIADAFGVVGKAVEDREIRQAEKDGANAVSRGPDGQLKVGPNPFSGRAGDVWERQASQALAARAVTDIRARGAALAGEANGDATIFGKSWATFSSDFLSRSPENVRGTLEIELERTGAQYSTGILNDARERSDKADAAAMSAALEQQLDDMAVLARNGGTSTAAFRNAAAKVRSILDEKVGNPNVVYGEAQRDLELRRIDGMMSAEAVLGRADRVLDADGPAAALKFADEMLSDTSISMSPSDRRAYSNVIRSRVSSWGAERKAALQPSIDLADEKLKGLKLGEGIDDPEIPGLIDTLTAGGAFEKAQELRKKSIVARLKRDLTGPGASTADRRDALRAALAGNQPEAPAGRTLGQAGPSATRALLLQRTDKDVSHIDGLDEAFGSKLAAMIQAAPPEIAAGLGIFSGHRSVERQAELWAGALKKYGSAEAARKWVAPPGRSNHNHGKAADLSFNGTSLRNAPPEVVAWVHANAERFGLKFPLANENWHIEDSSTRGGGQGSTPQIDPEIVAEIRDIYTDDVRRNKDTIKQSILRNMPPEGGWDSLVSDLTMLNDVALREELSDFIGQRAIADEFGELPPLERQERLAEFKRGLATSDGAALAEVQLLGMIEADETARAKAITDDPLSYSASHYEQSAGPMPPLDPFAAPDQVGAAIAARQRHAAFLRDHGEVALAPGLTKADGLAVQKLWSKGTPQQIATFTEAMNANLRPEVYAATMATKEMKEAITGAALSLTPERHNEAMRALDVMESRVGLFEVDRTYGKEVVDRLQEWQARVRYFSPEETKDWLKSRNDAQWQQRVKPLVDKGQGEARKVPFDEIVSGLDEAWFSDPGAPTDPSTVRMLQNDFVTLMGDAYAGVQDSTKARDMALERMKKRWGPSEAVGGRLMLFPPEAFYPPVGSSHDWIGSELSRLADDRGVDPGAMSLVPDRKTEAAIGRGEPPGYLVSIINPDTGLDELMVDEAGRPLRHFFDPNEAQAQAQADALEARRRMNDPWVTFSEGTNIGPFYPPWRPQTKADALQRQQRVREILDERQRRFEEKRIIRQRLRTEGIPGEQP